jgi:hypothetical protein
MNANASRRVLILVEGQTEERFTKQALYPHFLSRGIYLTPTILVTKRVKDGPSFKGGVTSFSHFERDLRRLLYGSGDALVTTLLDFYGLPDDFPGMADRSQLASPRDRVRHVEAAIHTHFGNHPRLLPFLALHEFETWLFSDPAVLPSVMADRTRETELQATLEEYGSPEAINERPEQAPSKRILRVFPGYRKPLHGPIAAQRIGLDGIRQACPHFSEWMDKLEKHTGNS